MRVLVTGAAGYIGSHAALALLEAGHDVVVLDSLLPGRGAMSAVDTVAGLAGARRFRFVRGDVNDPRALDEAVGVGSARVDAVMHFAGVAYVAESVADPLLYQRTNAAGTLAVVEACHRHSVDKLVFSSSCVTYGDPGPARLPIDELCPQSPTNPYGWSKLHAERTILDYAASRRRPGAANASFAGALLRYFNVAGCDVKGRLGHNHDPETRVIPLCLRAAMGIDPEFVTFGDDYPTGERASPDGTAVRDYIHVDDLVRAHLATLGALRPGDARVYNLGTGRPVSVRQIVASVERVTGLRVPLRVGPRRPGDPASLYCSPERAARELGWRAEVNDLDAIVSSAWSWMKRLRAPAH